MKALTCLLCLFLVLAACTPAQPFSTPQAEMEAAAPKQPAVDPEIAAAVPTMLREERQGEIRLIDPTTGKMVSPDYPPIVVVGGNPRFVPLLVPQGALSADGRRLVAVESHGASCAPSAGGTMCAASADVLHFVDLPNWHVVTAELPVQGWLGTLTYSPNASHVALVQSSYRSDTLLVYNTDTGKLVAQQALARDFRPTLLTYTQDGADLLVYGQILSPRPGMGKPDVPRVLLFNSTSLELRWEQPLENVLSGHWCQEECGASYEQRVFVSWSPAVLPSHDGRKLHIVHADESQLTTVDLEAHTVENVSIQAQRSWLEWLLAATARVAQAKAPRNGATRQAALSPDGKHLYVVGQETNFIRGADGRWERTETTYLGLQVIDVQTGRIVTSHEIEAAGIGFTWDGAYLLLGGSSDGTRWTKVYDAQTLEQVGHVDEWQVFVSQRMDGQPIILASQHTWQAGQWLSELAVLDPQSFEVLHSWSLDAYAAWLAAR